MRASSMLTVRIEPQLLAALKRSAKRNGRSVSAEVVALVEREVQPIRPGLRRKTMGMFEHLGEPPELADFKRFRRELATRVKRGLQQRTP